MNGIGRLVLGAALVLVAGAAAAHEMTMAELELRESAPGEFLVQWASGEKRPPAEELTPHWPAACVPETNVLRCGEQGLRGTLSMEGIGTGYSAALVKVFWLDGENRVYTLTAVQPTAQLYGSADDRRGVAEIARAYVVLGVEHILSGYDHLLFVASLLFLVGFNRRLLYTITAFTLAHSLTLALAALEIVTLRSPPVEAAIALSIVLVAREALHARRTLARRWPAVVAFLFGLIHGLGFAGALKDLGLPQHNLAVALLTFNVGVEIGQLLVVALAYALYRVLAGRPRFAAGRVPALYAIGAVAAYWSIARVVGIVA